MGAQLILLFITAAMVSSRLGKIYSGNQDNNKTEVTQNTKALLNLAILHLLLWWGGWYNVFIR